jgi:DGQHR domain-containing protein
MNEFKIRAIKFKQKDLTFYAFVINSKVLREIVYALPKSRDKPEALQRAIDWGRVEEIGKYIKSDPRGVFPNNVILNLDARVKFLEDPKNVGEGVLVFPKVQDEEKLGIILDGQHRLMGFEKSDDVEFDLPVVTLIDAPKDVQYKIFADINSLQIKVTSVLLQLLKFEIGELEIDKNIAATIVYNLEKDSDSPFKDRIKIYPQDKSRWIPSTSLTKWVLEIVGTGKVLDGKSVLEQKTILKNYFKAFKEIFEDQWKDRKQFVLTKAQGIELMCSLFPNIHQRCLLYQGKSLTVDAFKNEITKLKERKITLPTNVTVRVNWSRENFAPFTSGKAMKWLRKELLKALPPYEGEK